MSDNAFKRDEMYGYKVSLDENHTFAEGHHNVFELNEDDTEVTALQKILDVYFDTESLDSLSKFIDYKIDFSISFLDTICLILTTKLNEMNSEYEELERQGNDIAHRMTKGELTGQVFTKEEKIEMFDMQQAILVKRRRAKDTLTVMRVLLENMEKSRNFILGMNRRQFSPSSNRFQGDPEFKFKSKESQSRTAVTHQPKVTVQSNTLY